MKRVALIVTVSAALTAAAGACGQDEETPQPERTAAADPPEEQAQEPEPAAEQPAAGEQAARAGTGEQQTARAGTSEQQTARADTGEDQSDLECESADIVCPLFEWMEDNTKRAVEEGDVAGMAVAFHKIEFMTPVPEWDSEEHGENGWARLARRGAELAEAGDARAARRLCKGCHDQWRDEFRERGLRTAPMPELPENAAAGRPDL